MTTPAADDRPRHAPLRHFEVRDDCLQVGGVALTELAERMGSEPFYAYDRQVIAACVAQLRAVMPAALKLHYAVKANPMPQVVADLARQTDGLDVASAGELAIALATGITPSQVSFAGPGKSQADLRAAVDAGVIICLESEGELERVAEYSRRCDKRPPVAIRVNPDFELKISGLRMGGGAKPFGVDAERVPALLQRIPLLPVEFVGFHIYSGGQNLQSSAIIETQRKTFELAFELARSAPSPVRWLNIGGGLGVPYFPGEKALELTAIAKNLDTMMTAAQKRLPAAEVVMELGRYLVAEAGIYVCRIVDRKESRGETFLVTNGGMHHHLAASGNFGQVIRKNYPVAIGNHMTAGATERVTIVGPLCTPLDILADKAELPVAREGDLVVIFMSGAYGYSASPHNFLAHPPAAEILL